MFDHVYFCLKDREVVIFLERGYRLEVFTFRLKGGIFYILKWLLSLMIAFVA